MNLIFIFLFLFGLSRTFAWDPYPDCSDVSIDQFQWVAKDAFTVHFHSPPSVGCTRHGSQAGVEIISDYNFGSIYNIWSEREWVNGYNENNIQNCGRTGCPNCEHEYQGQQDYLWSGYIDRSKFPPSGSNITLNAKVYQKCWYDGQTHCGDCSLNLQIPSPPS
ncbi:hypothetical protein C1645_812142 [Glomus cerebriforme]|uniref:Uncharacterized protein n=1 Tax=Glomus cerebriforme TaxID=658196 RepID=A0A397TQU3_9GLOM|nr:hypothetical protein C1645_812142 [Glomus cerebriforme]